MNREQLNRASKEFSPLKGTAIMYMLFVEERKHIIETLTSTDPKSTDFVTMLRKVDTNPLQAVVVASAIEGVKEGDIVYINHRYYPFPMIHYGAIYHRVQATDILTVVDVPEYEVDRRLELKSGLGGKTWIDEPIELTRKDVLT